MYSVFLKDNMAFIARFKNEQIAKRFANKQNLKTVVFKECTHKGIVKSLYPNSVNEPLTAINP